MLIIKNMNMKKYIILLIATLSIISCTKDEDKWPEVMQDTDVGAAMPYIYFSTPKIFDIADINQTTIDFSLNVNATNRAKNWRRVVLMKSFNGGEFVQHAEYLPDDIPADISISVSDAIAGIDGLSIDSISGGDFFDWQFLMDVPDTLTYQAELIGTFPDFRSFFASSPVGFEVEGSYTMNLIYDDIGTADAQKTGYRIDLVPGSAGSQYILQDIGGTALLNLWDIEVAYRIYYIGNNSFVLNSTSEGFPGVVSLAGTVERDGDTGVITVEAVYERSCCGLNGAGISFSLNPEAK
jgi:hypothetical protein